MGSHDTNDDRELQKLEATIRDALHGVSFIRERRRVAEARNHSGPVDPLDPTLACSFCARSRREASHLITADPKYGTPRTTICDWCVDESAKIVARERQEAARKKPR